MTVCVTGMHRSGTSLVARVLNLCGLDLGPSDQMVPPDEGNPNGYWENRALDRLNEDILAQLGGGWNFLLPPINQGWESEIGLTPFRERASQLIQSMGKREPWGWKDPRCSLTLPFWKSLLPDLSVVVCLRNPQDVVRSLAKRAGGTPAFNYNLWLRYYRQILADTQPQERLVTHYSMYFLDPQSEVERVARWLGGSLSPEQIDEACQSIVVPNPSQSLGAPHSDDPPVPSEVAELYAELSADSGAGFIEAAEQDKLPGIRVAPRQVEPLPPTDTVSESQKAEAGERFESAQKQLDADQFAPALEALLEIIQLNPYHRQAHNDLGVLYFHTGELEHALGHLTIAMQMSPDDADAARNLAEIYVELGRVEDAVQTYLGHIERYPDDLDALLWLAAAGTKLGEKAQVKAYLQRVLAQQPDHQGAKDMLAAL